MTQTPPLDTQLLAEGRAALRRTPQAAQQQLETLLKGQPNNPTAQLLLAEALLVLNRPVDAAQYAATALRFLPGNACASKVLGRAFLAQGFAEEAWVVIKRAADADPHDKEASRLLTQAGDALRAPTQQLDDTAQLGPQAPSVMIDAAYRSEMGDQAIGSAEGPVRSVDALSATAPHSQVDAPPPPVLTVSHPEDVDSTIPMDILPAALLAAIPPPPQYADQDEPIVTSGSGDITVVGLDDPDEPTLVGIDDSQPLLRPTAVALAVATAPAIVRPIPIVVPRSTIKVDRVQDAPAAAPVCAAPEPSPDPIDAVPFLDARFMVSEISVLIELDEPTPTPTPLRSYAPPLHASKLPAFGFEAPAVGDLQAPMTPRPRAPVVTPTPPKRRPVVAAPSGGRSKPPGAAEPAPWPAAMSAPTTPRKAHRNPEARVKSPAVSARATPAAPRLRVSPKPLSRRHWAALFTTAGVVLLVGVLALVGGWMHRHDAQAFDQGLSEARVMLRRGNHLDRISATDRLSTLTRTPTPNILVRATERARRVFGQAGLHTRRRILADLVAYTEVTRVVDGGEVDRRGTAEDALDFALSLDLEAPNAQLGVVRLLAQAGHSRQAWTDFQGLSDEIRDSVEGQWVGATFAYANGDLKTAIEWITVATQRDPEHPYARWLALELRSAIGDRPGALQAYAALISQQSTEPHHARISLERLRVRVDKRADDAVSALRRMLEHPSTLSPLDRALIYDTFGLYYERRGKTSAARTAYLSARAAAPALPRFTLGLARMDLRARKLKTAEAALREIDGEGPVAEAVHRLLAELHLLRGAPHQALAALDKIRTNDVDALLLRGRAQLRAGQAAAAERTLQSVVQRTPNLSDAHVYLLLARAYASAPTESLLAELRQRARGGVTGERLIDRGLPLRAYGEALLRASQPKAALHQFKRAIAVDAADHEAQTLLCRLYALTLDAELAIEHCRAALRANPHYLPAAQAAAYIAEAQGDAGAVVAVLAPIFSEGRKGPPALIRALARARIARDEAPLALSLVKGGLVKGNLVKGRLASKASQATTRYVHGLVAAYKGTPQAAREDLKAAVEGLPKDPWSHLALGDALAAMGDTTGARGSYRAAMALTAGPLPALKIARVNLRERRWRAARQAAKEAMKRSEVGLSSAKTKAEALAVYAKTWMSVANGPAKARGLVRRALKLEPDQAEALLLAGRLAEAAGQHAQAAAHYHRVTQVQPKNPEGFYRLGRVQLALPGQGANGRAALDATRALDPNGPWGVRATRLLTKR